MKILDGRYGITNLYLVTGGIHQLEKFKINTYKVLCTKGFFCFIFSFVFKNGNILTYLI